MSDGTTPIAPALFPDKPAGSDSSPSAFRQLYDIYIFGRNAQSRLGFEGAGLEGLLERLLSESPPEITISAQQVKVGCYPLNVLKQGEERGEPDPFAAELRQVVIEHIQARLAGLLPEAEAQLARTNALLEAFPADWSKDAPVRP